MGQAAVDSGLPLGPSKTSDVLSAYSNAVEPAKPRTSEQHTYATVKSTSSDSKPSTRLGRRVYTGGYVEGTTPVEVAGQVLQLHMAEVRCEEGTDLKHSVQVGAHC